MRLPLIAQGKLLTEMGVKVERVDIGRVGPAILFRTHVLPFPLRISLLPIGSAIVMAGTEHEKLNKLSAKEVCWFNGIKAVCCLSVVFLLAAAASLVEAMFHPPGFHGLIGLYLSTGIGMGLWVFRRVLSELVVAPMGLLVGVPLAVWCLWQLPNAVVQPAELLTATTGEVPGLVIAVIAMQALAYALPLPWGPGRDTIHALFALHAPRQRHWATRITYGTFFLLVATCLAYVVRS